MHARLQVYLLLVSFTLLAVTCAYPEDASRTPVSEDTLNTALNDRRYLMRQIKCALGEAPCDPVGRRLKSLAPLVLRGSCPKCTPDEMRQIQRVLSHIQKNFPKEWNKIVQQFAG
ncbi:uncharacterized protein CBL_12279 [Carabus blaptoides fortunei]